MSPAMNSNMTPGASGWSPQTPETSARILPEPSPELSPESSVEGWTSAPDDSDRLALQHTPEEALEDEENNPWRNHEDDGHKWLGLLLATVGAGAIGYLVAGI